MTTGDKGKLFIIVAPLLYSYSQQDCVLPVYEYEKGLFEFFKRFDTTH